MGSDQRFWASPGAPPGPRISLAIALSLTLVACNDGESSGEEGGEKAPNGGEASPAPSDGDPPPTSEYDYDVPLPGILSIGLCDPGPPARPPACDWVHSLDGLIWGELVDVRPATAPGVMASDGGDLVDECPGTASAALDLDIEVQEVIAGEEISGRITIRVGSRHRERWDPLPGLNEDGELEWQQPSEGWITVPSPFVIGRGIGVPFRIVEDFDLLSLTGESLFAEEDEENGESRIREQPLVLGTCPVTMLPPQEFDDRTLHEWRDLTASCGPPTELAERIREGAWTPPSDPRYYAAATCW